MIVYTIEQAAAVLQVHPNTIKNEITNNRLSAVFIENSWRISDKSLIEYFETNSNILKITSDENKNENPTQVTKTKTSNPRMKPYKVAEIAKLLGISRRTVTRIINEGKMSCIKATDKLFLVPVEAYEKYTDSWKNQISKE